MELSSSWVSPQGPSLELLSSAQGLRMTDSVPIRGIGVDQIPVNKAQCVSSWKFWGLFQRSWSETHALRPQGAAAAGDRLGDLHGPEPAAEPPRPTFHPWLHSEPVPLEKIRSSECPRLPALPRSLVAGRGPACQPLPS